MVQQAQMKPDSASRPTLEQRRAAHAWKAVTALAIRIEGGRRIYDGAAVEYEREAHKLPIRIIASGLGQALAFIEAKAKGKKLDKLLKDLTDWAKERPLPLKRPDSLLLSVVEGDSDFLRRATEETLAYLQWLNRFLEAEIGKDKATGGGEGE